MASQPSIGSRWGVRRRSVVIAVVVVFLALASGGGLLVLLLQSALASASQDATVARAAEITDLAAKQGITEAVQEVRGATRPPQLVQIISDTGVVLGASSPRIAFRPLSGLAPSVGQTLTVKADIEDVGTSDDYLIVARTFSVKDRPYTVQVATPVEVQVETIQTVAVFLLGATPLLLLVVGVAVWFLVGRALEPVEIIRSQVARIDARRLAERVAVPPTRDEIAALAETMNVMLDRLEASDRAQRSFVSDASHELRSPLSTVIMAAEVSAADPTAGLWQERLKTILIESKRMQFLVDNLMTLAKADSHELDLRMADVDLDDVLDSEVRRLRVSSQHRIIARMPPVRVIGDSRRLTQVIRNLLENADRHARSTIEVSVVIGADEVTVHIDNDGDSIAPAMRDHVFERFVRLDDSRSRDFGGSGLGLAISAEIAHAHSGVITAAETASGWCRFEVTLPLPQGDVIDPQP